MTMATMTTSTRRTARCAIALAATLATALGVAGCREHDGMSNVRAVHLNNPEIRHPIGFSRRSETVLVELPRDGYGLSEAQRTDVYRFVRNYKTESTGPLSISSPRRTGQHFAARKALRDIDDILARQGLHASIVHRGRHGSGGHHRPVLRLSYQRPVAVAPRCGNWPKDLGVNRERVHYENFGCATQRNFARTVANPRDIMGPQPASPRSSARRDTIWKEYVGSEAGSAGSRGPDADSTTAK